MIGTTPLVTPQQFIAQPIVPPVSKPPTLWPQKFPSIISALFAFFQAVVTIAIIGCEIGSVLIDAVTATVYVGFWAGLFFLVAFVAQSVSSCCCRERGYAIFTLVSQCIALVFAACVIGFDAYYLVYPSTCYFPSSTCVSNGTSRGAFYSTSNFNNVKIPLIKGQLAAGSVMFVLCLVAIFLFILTAIRVHHAQKPTPIQPQTYIQTPYGLVPTPVASAYRPMTVIDPQTGRMTEIECPTCTSKLGMTVRQPYVYA